MEQISSRKNAYIKHVRSLASDRAYREQAGEYVCDGIKTLKEAVSYGAEIVSVLWKDKAEDISVPGANQYVVPEELFDYASPMKNSPGPLFCVKMPDVSGSDIKNAVVLETVQDPGNVGTVVRTANAFGIDAVILTSACADLYNPKTVRATMGAIFRQKVIRVEADALAEFLKDKGLKLYGAALTDKAVDVRSAEIKNAAVAIGSEGRGLSARLLDMCDGQIIIPMRPDSESLNAAVAASILMWEMCR